jgi:SagB-type dehydrogenase family enzyme
MPFDRREAKELIWAAVSHTSVRPDSANLAGTAFRTHRFRLDNRNLAAPDPAEEFLIAGRLRRWDRALSRSITSYFDDDMTVVRSRIDSEPDPESPRFPLPPPVPLRAGLSDVVMRRRSVRQFRAGSVPLADLGTVLRHCAAVTAEAEEDLAEPGEGAPFVTTRFRAVPSAGALYPVEVWVAVQRVSGLAPGVYRYLPLQDALAFHDDDQALARLHDTFVSDEAGIELGAAAFFMLLVGHPWRSMRKYGPRGLRFVLHEAGAIAFAAHLAIVAMDLGAVDHSGFYDEEASDVLGLDGQMDVLLHSIAVGVPR